MSVANIASAMSAWVEEFEGGEVRYYTNDGGPRLSGEIEYEALGAGKNVKCNNFVGLVDEKCGGMIAYGPDEIMEELCDKLNKLDVIERIAANG